MYPTTKSYARILMYLWFYPSVYLLLKLYQSIRLYIYIIIACIAFYTQMLWYGRPAVTISCSGLDLPFTMPLLVCPHRWHKASLIRFNHYHHVVFTIIKLNLLPNYQSTWTISTVVSMLDQLPPFTIQLGACCNSVCSSCTATGLEGPGPPLGWPLWRLRHGPCFCFMKLWNSSSWLMVNYYEHLWTANE